MTKLMNLDEITAQESREIKFKDKTYALADLDVRRFIEINQANKVFSKALDKNDPEEIFLAAEKIVSVAIPTLDDETLRQFNIKQLMATVQLIMLGNGPAEDEASSKASEGNAPATE